MRFRIEQRFAGPLQAVEDAFVDPAFLEELATLPKLGGVTLMERAESADGNEVRMRVRYRFNGEVNAAVRRVVDPERLTWVEESTLDRSTHVTTWRIVPDHYGGMIRCAGTFRLEPAGGAGTRRIAEADIKVNVPFVGGKVERAIVSGLEEHAALEERAMDGWLRSSPS